MRKTVSCHNGHAVSRQHNIRAYKEGYTPDHINPELTEKNIILVDMDHRQAYRDLFGDALAEYNERQKRPERRIKDYYDTVANSAKQHPVYEVIVQIGDKDDTGVEAEVETECILQYCQEWKQRNPRLALVGAYIHRDEDGGTVHAHVDYIPVATGYKRGMSRQAGLAKALEQMGFPAEMRDVQIINEDTKQIQTVKKRFVGESVWAERERNTLRDIAKANGIELAPEAAESRRHENTDNYKRRKEAERLVTEAQKAQKRLQNIQVVLEHVQRENAAQGALNARLSAEGDRLLEKKERASAELADLNFKIDIQNDFLQSITNAVEEKNCELNVLQKSIGNARAELGKMTEAVRAFWATAGSIFQKKINSVIEEAYSNMQAAFDRGDRATAQRVHRDGQQAIGETRNQTMAEWQKKITVARRAITKIDSSKTQNRSHNGRDER